MFQRFTPRLFGIALLAMALSAHAALPTVTMSFDQSSGVVGPNDSIDVWVTVKVDATSSPLVFDSSSGAPFGFAAADLPAQGSYFDASTGVGGTADFVSYSGVQTNTYYSCNTTFAASCIDGPPYDFQFHTTSEPGKPSFNFLTELSLQPGQSFSYLFGSFTPSAGAVAAGTYSFYRSGATLLFQGLDADGHDLIAYYTMGETCPTDTADCAFTRTVVAVPEPATFVLTAIGLLIVAFRIRRQRRN